MVIEPEIRTHGFERPFDVHQAASWYVMGSFAIIFFVLYSPIEVGPAGITVDCLYGLFIALTVFFGVMSMSIDPSDDGAIKARNSTASMPAEPPPPNATNHCGLCDAYVLKRSKHCRRCNKCVDTFDHHCPWLNTCVGRKNYPYFMGLLCSVFSLTAVQIGAYIHAGVRQINVESQRERLADVFGGLSALAYGILLSVFGALVVPAMLLVFQLFSFHLGLIRREMTTYEFIMAQRKKEKEWAAASGGVETWRLRANKWINRNAPCLAVCILCDEPATTTREAAPAPASKPKRLPPCTKLQQQICTRARKQDTTEAAPADASPQAESTLSRETPVRHSEIQRSPSASALAASPPAPAESAPAAATAVDAPPPAGPPAAAAAPPPAEDPPEEMSADEEEAPAEAPAPASDAVEESSVRIELGGSERKLSGGVI